MTIETVMFPFARGASLLAVVVTTLGCGASDEKADRSEPSSASATASTTPEGVIDGMFSVDGHDMYLHCEGMGEPTFVFDAGHGGGSSRITESSFLDDLGTPPRQCVYDRANTGRSQNVAGTRTSADAVSDLHELLDVADVPGPYVLVGFSFGGYNVRLYAATYPDQMAGLVMVDTVTPSFHAELHRLLTAAQWEVEVADVQTPEAPMDFLASSVLVAASSLPDIPLLVVAATSDHKGDVPWPDGWPADTLDEAWDRAQEELAASAPRGRLVTIDSTHRIHVHEPAALADAIRTFLAEDVT